MVGTNYNLTSYRQSEIHSTAPSSLKAKLPV